jgi:Crp-like helix-turn-helix domain
MYSVYTPQSIEESLSRWRQICRWARQHDRCYLYQKDEPITCESGLIYFVRRGVVRLSSQPMGIEDDILPSLLSLVGAAQPFELVRELHVSLQATAHVKNTEVFWIKASEVATVPGFEIDVLQAFRYQHQRHILRLNNLTRGRAVDQLLGYLHLVGEEFGEEDNRELHIPFPLTHSQLAGAIGSTRVTVTRLLGDLRKVGEIRVQGGNRISLPIAKNLPPSLHLVE